MFASPCIFFIPFNQNHWITIWLFYCYCTYNVQNNFRRFFSHACNVYICIQVCRIKFIRHSMRFSNERVFRTRSYRFSTDPRIDILLFFHASIRVHWDEFTWRILDFCIRTPIPLKPAILCLCSRRMRSVPKQGFLQRRAVGFELDLVSYLRDY